jgi:hypothetical protein
MGVASGVAMVLEGAVRRSRRLLALCAALLARVGIGARGAQRLGRNLNRLVLWAFLLLIGTLVNAPDWRTGIEMWSQMGRLPAELLHGDLSPSGAAQLSATVLILPVAILALEIYEALDARAPVFGRLAARGRAVSWPFYYALAAIVIAFGAYGQPDFIYFNF